jgi:hypothetical protein
LVCCDPAWHPVGNARDRGEVDVLAVLPDVTPDVPSSVEGLTVGPDDNIYVTSFGFNRPQSVSSMLQELEAPFLRHHLLDYCTKYQEAGAIAPAS